MCAKVMADLTGKSLAQILEDSERDFFMGPEEAKAYGLIDKITLPSQRTNQP
jgi:ATP-dependent Clp protease protease subunit